MVVHLETAARSVAGPHRRDNQDSVGVGPCFAFVADGVGGHAGGDVASWTVTHRLMAVLLTGDVGRLGADDLRELVAIANAELALRAGREPRLRGMATTFTGLFCGADGVTVAHIGDSRAYLVRDGAARRVTRDDSLVQALVDQGVVDEADAWDHPQRNLILRSLSGDLADPEGLTLLRVDARPGDRWLLTSDGLSDAVPEPVLLDLLTRPGPADDVVGALLDAAVEADAHDDVSVAVCDVIAGEPPAGETPRSLGAAADDALGHVGVLVPASAAPAGGDPATRDPEGVDPGDARSSRG